MTRKKLVWGFIFLFTGFSFSQALDFTSVQCKVDFTKPIRLWDGFGFNYVETAQTMDYTEFTQEYGGFSLLDEEEKSEIIDLVFGDDGLKVGLVKMFLDPHHQSFPGGPYDHKLTTKNMVDFVKKGYAKTQEWGGDLEIITTLYGPPAFTTKQKILRGRDLDPYFKHDVANYMIDWVKYLRNDEGLPVNYISLHNEGEDWHRWTSEGFTDWAGHDYNMYWSPAQVVDYLTFMPVLLRNEGLSDILLTPGETSNWYRFDSWGYASAIANDDDALDNLGLITSHGFYRGNYGEWFGEHKSAGIDKIREKRPDLHAWVTSTSWSNMDANNIKEMHGNIYTSKVNGIIPWAGIQRPSHWAMGDPNPGSAIKVNEDGSYEIRRGYYYYKQISCAGQPGMAVVDASAMDSEIAIIGFGHNNSPNVDAFCLINTGITAFYHHDAVELNFFDGKQSYHFNLADPTVRINKNDPLSRKELEFLYNDKNIKSATKVTDTGYNLEVAIPWSLLQLNPQTTLNFGFDVEICDMSYTHTNHLGWRDEGFVVFENPNDNSATLHKVEDITVDASKETNWEASPSYRMDRLVEPTTSSDFVGTWQGAYDDEHLYLFIKINDSTHFQGRKTVIDVVGSHFKKFAAYRTTDDGEQYNYIGDFSVQNGQIIYDSPMHSVTTFFGLVD